MKFTLGAVCITALLASTALADTKIKPVAPPQPTFSTQSNPQSISPTAIVAMLLVLALIGAASQSGSAKEKKPV